MQKVWKHIALELDLFSKLNKRRKKSESFDRALRRWLGLKPK